MSPDPRERDLVKCEDMRLYAERAVRYLGARSLKQFLQMIWPRPRLSTALR